MAKKQRLVTPKEAAEKLGISMVTARLWMKRGRLPVVKEKVVVERDMIPYSALKHAFECTCLWCGDIFESKHPEIAKFCCTDHAARHHRLHRKSPPKKKAKKK